MLVVFDDLLWLDGHDLTPRPLSVRRTVLEELGLAGHWQLTGRLADPARLEIQVRSLSRRWARSGLRLEQHRFQWLVAVMASVGGSLLVRTESEWMALIGSQRDPALLHYARDRLHLPRVGEAMDWDEDVWDLRRAAGTAWDMRAGRRLRFDPIPQVWLRQLAKRWSRLRLASRSPLVLRSNLTHLNAKRSFICSIIFAPLYAYM